MVLGREHTNSLKTLISTGTKERVGDSKSENRDEKKLVPVEDGNEFEFSSTERERIEKERRSAGALSYADIVTKQMI